MQTLLDGFCGTGAVAAEALARGVGRVVAVDNLLSCTVVLRGFACATRAARHGLRGGRLLNLIE